MPLTADTVAVAEDGSIPITLTGSDPENDALDYRLETYPAHGTLDGSPPNLIYKPAPNYHGTDHLVFSTHDGATNSALATISITITPAADAPYLHLLTEERAG